VNRRIIVLVVDDTDTAEDLRSVLDYAVVPPWRPVPPGKNTATYKQERWDQESTDELLLERLKRAAPKIHWMGNSIIPPTGDRT
jgi:hypothetical protein